MITLGLHTHGWGGAQAHSQEGLDGAGAGVRGIELGLGFDMAGFILQGAKKSRAGSKHGRGGTGGLARGNRHLAPRDA